MKRDGSDSRGTTPIAQIRLSHSFDLTALQPAGPSSGFHFQHSSSGVAYVFGCRGPFQTGGPSLRGEPKFFPHQSFFMLLLYYFQSIAKLKG